MIEQVRRFLIGDPLSTDAASHERLNRGQALALLSSDALSSVAYATEEILVVLAVAGTAALSIAPPLALAISALVAVVITSYYQTIHAYPKGGGAYLVSLGNLGTNAGLVAGAALLIDYVLTVAVSISAGIAAVTSAFPALLPHRVALALAALALVTVVNLRGLRESGRAFALPTYFFMFAIFSMIIVGLVRAATGSIPMPHYTATESLTSLGALPLFLILRAFSSGCTALTGIEAISDGVTVFRKPEAKNATATLVWMGALLVAMFLGLTFLADYLSLVPQEGETVVSQIARAVFGDGVLYYSVQAATTLILLLAANTSFSDFPRLANFIARDRFLPARFTHLGDRLVFSSGIQALALTAGALIVIFGAQPHALIPLYAVGVFVSFTLSQSGMVLHWMKLRTTSWRRSAILNAVGALTTGTVMVVVAVTKFTQGAWITLLLIATLVVLFRQIRSHYDTVTAQLSLEKAWPEPIHRHTVIVPIDTIHRGVVKAMNYAKSIQGDLRIVTIEIDPDRTAAFKAQWEATFPDMQLDIQPSPYRSLIKPLIDYAEGFIQQEGDYVTFILPEFVPAHWWQRWLHDQTSHVLRQAMFDTRQNWGERYHVITGIRFFLSH